MMEWKLQKIASVDLIKNTQGKKMFKPWMLSYEKSIL